MKLRLLFNIFKAISFDKSSSGRLANELKIIYYEISNNKESLSSYKINLIVDNSSITSDNNSLNTRVFYEFKRKITSEIKNINIYTLSQFGERVINNNF